MQRGARCHQNGCRGYDPCPQPSIRAPEGGGPSAYSTTGLCFVLSPVPQHSPSSISAMLRLPFATTVISGVAYLDDASRNFFPLKYATLRCSFRAKGETDDFTRSRGHRDAADCSSRLRGASADLPLSLSATVDSAVSGTGRCLRRWATAGPLLPSAQPCVGTSCRSRSECGWSTG